MKLKKILPLFLVFSTLLYAEEKQENESFPSNTSKESPGNWDQNHGKQGKALEWETNPRQSDYQDSDALGWDTNGSGPLFRIREGILESFSYLSSYEQEDLIQKTAQITLGAVLTTSPWFLTQLKKVAKVPGISALLLLQASTANADETLEYYFTPEGVLRFSEDDQTASFALKQFPQLRSFFEKLHDQLINQY